jgi:hypothetical protein
MPPRVDDEKVLFIEFDGFAKVLVFPHGLDERRGAPFLDAEVTAPD